MEKIELLAPAGNLRILKAAVDSGADAVYCGLTVFNARINAENLALLKCARVVWEPIGENALLLSRLKLFPQIK